MTEWFGQRDRAAVPIVAAEAESVANSPMPDESALRDTSAEGLANGAYLAMRGKEECYRAHRYGRPLSLVFVKLQDADRPTERKLQNWLRSDTRSSDLAAYLGDGQYALLLVETDKAAATSVLTRLLVAFPRAFARAASHPGDGRSWEALFASVHDAPDATSHRSAR